MKREEISKIISGVDMEYVEEAKTINRLYSPKKLVAMVLASTLSLSLVGWTWSVIVKYLPLGGTYTESYNPLTGMHSSSVSMGDTEMVFEEIDGEVYFIYDGKRQNITEYCSANDYFSYENLDDNGNGFVIVVGGSKGNRGQFIYNFEDFTMFAGTGDFNGDADIKEGSFEPPWLENASLIYRTVRLNR